MRHATRESAIQKTLDHSRVVRLYALRFFDSLRGVMFESDTTCSSSVPIAFAPSWNSARVLIWTWFVSLLPFRCRVTSSDHVHHQVLKTNKFLPEREGRSIIVQVYCESC